MWIKLLTLAVLSTLFSWIQSATRWQFCGHVDKLPDLGSFDSLFSISRGLVHKLQTLVVLMAQIKQICILYVTIKYFSDYSRCLLASYLRPPWLPKKRGNSIEPNKLLNVIFKPLEIGIYAKIKLSILIIELLEF